ncbi:MAG: SDH family Clp fold serine proteinase [Hyphomicrobium sp.]
MTTDEAHDLGRLPVKTEMPPQALEPLSLYPQPIRGIPTVEYLGNPPLPKGQMTGRKWYTPSGTGAE